MRIAIAADHNAVSMKSRLSAWLTERGHQIDDRGAHDANEVADRIAGLAPDDAEAALEDLGHATVELWPDWVASVPTMGWRIEVRVAER